MTAVALHTQKAVLEATAFEIRLEFLMYVVGQNLALGCQLRHKRWVVLGGSGGWRGLDRALNSEFTDVSFRICGLAIPDLRKYYSVFPEIYKVPYMTGLSI